MTANKKDCSEIEPLLSAYRDGEASAEEQAKTAEHLPSCSDCQTQLTSIEQVASVLNSLPKAQARRDFDVDIDLLLAKNAEIKKVVPFKRPAVWILAAAAAAAVVLSITLRLGPSGQSTAPELAKLPPQGQSANPVVSPKQAPPEQLANDQKPAALERKPRHSSSPEIASANKPPRGASSSGNEPRIANAGHPEHALRQPSALRTAALEPVVAEAPGSPPEDAKLQLRDVEIASISGNDHNTTEAIGLETDEDGLYALKL